MQLIVNGVTFNYPDPGTEQGWGEDATAWAEEVTAELDRLSNGIGTQYLISLNNNQSTFADILKFVFDSDEQIAVSVDYFVTINGDISDMCERGTINLAYENASWVMNRVITSTDLSGMQFTVNAVTGQVQYKTPNYLPTVGTSVEVSIMFKNINVLESGV